MSKMWWLQKENIFKDTKFLNALNQIEKIARSSDYNQKKIIYSSDLAGDSLHFIKNGYLRLFRLSSQGSQINLAYLTKGDIFGKLSMFEEGERDVSVQSLSDVTINILRQRQLEKLMKNNPEIAAFVFLNIEEKLKQSWQQFDSSIVKQTVKRIARLFLKLTEHYGICVPESLPNKIKRIEYKINNKELSNLIGIKREIILQVMDYLINTGLLKQENGYTIIKDKKGLADIL